MTAMHTTPGRTSTTAPTFKPVRTRIPAPLDARDWSALEPLFRELLARPVSDLADFEQWLIDRSELDAACAETQANLYISMTCSTDDKSAAEAYSMFMETIPPKIKPLAFELDKKVVSLAAALKPDERRFGVMIRDLKADVDLFRPENVEIETALDKLSQEYETIAGAQTVVFRGEEKTLPQMAVYQENTDRATREEAWRLVSDRRLKDKAAIDGVYDAMIAKRDTLARNAGFKDYVGYAFKAKHRFDYGVGHCEAFHRACEQVLTPMIHRMEAKRKASLKLDELRPWDLSVDVKGRPPLRPFEGGRALMQKAIATFDRLDPRLGTMLRSMGDGTEARGSRDGACLDLDSRKGKAPGGYQYMRDRERKAFIFMNAAGVSRDVSTMLHEAGHAFHSMLCIDEPLLHYRHAPIEFCEVASMGMELLTLPHIGKNGDGSSGADGYYGGEDLARARRLQIERSVLILPWIATIDAFQIWVYSNPNHTPEQRTAYWLELDRRFGSSCSWAGLEEHRRYAWHRQPHLFSHPFYYIEYGIAQLGALQLWLMGLEKGEKTAVDYYVKGLSLGGSRPLPELFEATGLKFDFGPDTVKRLVDRAETELAKLPE